MPPSGCLGMGSSPTSKTNRYDADTVRANWPSRSPLSMCSFPGMPTIAARLGAARRVAMRTFMRGHRSGPHRRVPNTSLAATLASLALAQLISIRTAAS